MRRERSRGGSRSNADRKCPPNLKPLLVGQKDLPELFSMSDRFIRKLQDTGRFPVAVRLGTRKLWSVSVLERWVEDGCPALREES